jgi:hypothetical protein
MNKLTLVIAAVLAAGGCKDKGGGENKAAAVLAKMEELKTEMCTCKDVKCAQGVSDKMTKWVQEQAKDQKEPPKMSDAEQKKAGALGEEMGKCMQAAMAAAPVEPAAPGSAAEGSAGSAAVQPPVAAGSAAPAVGADGLPVECAEYKATVEKLKTCEAISQGLRDALVKGYNDAVAGWLKLPATAKVGLNTSCKAGTQAIVDAVKERCGW